MDLMCEEDWKVGFLGSSYFVGWTSSLLWLPRLADVYGRKKCYVIAMVADTLLFTALFFTSSVNVAIAIIFTTGFFASFRVGVGFIYLMELVPSKARVAIGSAWGVLEASIMLNATLYFMLSQSKNWLYYGLFGYSTQIFALVVSLFLPESPKWLLEQNRVTSAKESLMTIAKWNRQPHVFDERDFGA